MRPTVEDLQDIWLFTYSRAAFVDTVKFLAELDKAEPRSLQYRALVEAAVVAYARPFTACFLPPDRRVKPIGDVLPPEHLADIHENVLNLRHTIVGHKDATPGKGYTATPNIVLVDIHPDDEIKLNIALMGTVAPALRDLIGKLCVHFINHCDENLNRLKKLYRAEFLKKPPGEYELVISEPPADWLIPFRTKHGDDFRKQPD